MIIGGYTNERPLTPEHEKLPPEMRRRVGQSIKVYHVDDELIIYKNMLANIQHTYRKINGRWRWVHTKNYNT